MAKTSSRSLRQKLILGLICEGFALPALTIFLFAPLLVYTLPSQWASFILLNPVYTAVNDTFNNARYNIWDTLAIQGRHAEPHPDLVYVAIDNESFQLDALWDDEIEASPVLQKMKAEWPWKRDIYAPIIRKIFEAGARAIAIDLLFLTPTDEDAALKEVLDEYKDRIVVGGNLVVSQRQTNKDRFDPPSDSLIPQTNPIDSRVGAVNFIPGRLSLFKDDTIRKAIYYLPSIYSSKALIPSLSMATLQKIGEGQSIPKQHELIFMRMSLPGSYTPISIYELFWEEGWKRNLKEGALFKDKIVVIGPDGNFFQDEHPTPLGIMPGPELHLNAIAAGLRGDFIRESSPWLNLLIILASALLAWGLILLVSHPLLRFFIIILIPFAYLFLLQYLYDHEGLFLISFSPIFTFASGAITCTIYEFVLERLEKSRIRGQFEKYVSQNVVAQMLDNPAFESVLSGSRRPVTVLFSDIRGFTTMTENADEQQLVEQLNEYLTEMVECVFSHNGTLDKFIGDAVMAVWGNTFSKGAREDACDAVRAGLAMRRELARLNKKWWDEDNRASLAIGIGLNHGEVIVGNMGSPKRMEFTVIGDAVNLASRLEGLTKEHAVDLLIGESVAHLVKEDFHLRSLALEQVKGKTKPVEVFTVLGEKSEPLPEDKLRLLELYHEGIDFYRSREFEKALEKFEKSLEIDSGDGHSQRYVELCREFIAEPPDEDWTGVNVRTKK